MKIRTGFVSNSSSSSFIIMGYELSFDEADPSRVDGVYMRGREIGEGRDFFELTSEIYDYIKNNNLMPELIRNNGTLLFYKVFQMNEVIEINPKDFVTLSSDKKLKIWNDEVDYHTTQGLSDFKERYIDNN